MNNTSFAKYTLSLAVVTGLTLVAERAPGDTFAEGEEKFDIEFVTIGNPGNPADTTGAPNPAGSVPYTFRMSKFEISEGIVKKAKFEMAKVGIQLGIAFEERGDEKPVTKVTWFDAARYVNFLNLNSGNHPAYNLSDLTFSATFDLWQPTDPGYDPANPYRNSLAKYFLPNTDEWYKAAYYDPDAGVYYDYATGSDTVPTSVANGTAPGTAVYNQSGVPADVSDAGGLSPYGTMAQGGNVWEWEESDHDLAPGTGSNRRAVRGSFWAGSNVQHLSSSSRGPQPTNTPRHTVGFRVASIAIPEPGTFWLASLATLVCLSKRRR